MKKLLSTVSIVLTLCILMSLSGCAISSRRRAENEGGSSSKRTRDKNEKDDDDDDDTEYLRKAKQLDDDTVKDIESAASAVFNDSVKSTWGAGEDLESLTYIGNYLLIAEDEDEADEHNRFYLVYKVRLHNSCASGSESYDSVHDYFWYVRYDDLTIDDDDKVVFDKDASTTPKDSFTVQSGVSGIAWTYYGYETLEELYAAIVTSNEDVFKCNENIDTTLTAGPTNTPTPTPTPTPNPAQYPPKEMKCSDVSASAYYIQGEGTSSEKPHYPTYAVDNDMKTAWNVRAHVENGEKVTTRGVGEWLEFTFEPGTYLQSVVIHPGFVYSTDDSVHRFERNYAPTKLLITAGGQNFEVDLGDYAYSVSKAMEGYTYTFPDWIKLTDGKIRITILEVRNIYAEQGKDGPWDDCCISEIKFWGIDPID